MKAGGADILVHAWLHGRSVRAAWAIRDLGKRTQGFVCGRQTLQLRDFPSLRPYFKRQPLPHKEKEEDKVKQNIRTSRLEYTVRSSLGRKWLIIGIVEIQFQCLKTQGFSCCCFCFCFAIFFSIGNLDWKVCTTTNLVYQRPDRGC